MLLKKIFYGYTRIRYVIAQQESDGSVSFTFCRSRPLGPIPGRFGQYQNNIYTRKKDTYKILRKINKACKYNNNLYFSYEGPWWVTFYQNEIKEIVFGSVINNFWTWYFIFLLLYYIVKK